MSFLLLDNFDHKRTMLTMFRRASAGSFAAAPVIDMLIHSLRIVSTFACSPGGSSSHVRTRYSVGAPLAADGIVGAAVEGNDCKEDSVLSLLIHIGNTEHAPVRWRADRSGTVYFAATTAFFLVPSASANV